RGREPGLRRTRIAKPGPVAERDDPLLGNADQRAARDEVRLDEALGERVVRVYSTVEAVVEAGRRERPEERSQRGHVGPKGRPKTQRATVPQDDVHGLGSAPRRWAPRLSAGVR